MTGDAETLVSPGLRPEVLGDAAQRQTKALVHAALFKGTGEAPTIGPYRALTRLGEGGMGVVYAAYDDTLERKVALKLLRGAIVRRPEGRARTLREARALARLSHPNVVHVYQVGEVDDEVFVAMEFLTGPTLRAWLKGQPRTWREVLAVFRQAGEGLAAAHRQGVIHRDFKPANVIVGDDGRVRVLDFGLAHFGDDREATAALSAAGEPTDVLRTQTGAVLGTPAYMAAEQFAGARGDARTDQFSFCTALYEALYGQRPFAGDTLAALVPAVTAGRIEPVKAGRDVPAWLHRVVVRGLQPDPAQRWPSMDALLAALEPPAARRGRIAAVVGSSAALLLGGSILATRTAPDDPQRLAEREAAARAQAEMRRSQDEQRLTEARAALTRDPADTIRALARLAGDDPATWQRARFFAAAAQARGLPAEVLRAGESPLAEVQPLAGGGLVGRDELGAVWQWNMTERTGIRVLAPGAATDLWAARDVPVWAVKSGASVRVFGSDRAQTIDVGAVEAAAHAWRLASDGRTLVAVASKWHKTAAHDGAIHLWDLTRPGSPPQTIALPPETLPVIADDASVVVHGQADGLRVVRPGAGAGSTLPYRGTPWTLSADRRFLVASPADRDGVLDVIELATGTSRRVEAGSAVVLGGADALFMRPFGPRVLVWRESLATSELAWQLQVPAQGGAIERRLIVDPDNNQFAVALGEQWGVGDLGRGELTSFLTVPKDRSPQWAGPGALMVAVRDEVRLHRPSTAPVQLRRRAWDCALSPGGRWAAALPWDVARGAFERIDLTTGATATFRCPTTQKTQDLGGEFASYSSVTAIDDAGQIAMLGEGWSCWWDEQHGARTGQRALTWGLVAALPRGVAIAEGAEVEVWSGPDEKTRSWTAAGTVADLQASPSGALLAVRSDRGIQVLRDTGEVVPVVTEPTPAEPRAVTAGALAWSPDGARLAALDPVDGSLALTVWDVAGPPREVARYGLKDSPGRPRNQVAFTPTGAAAVLTDRHGSLMRIDLAGRETRRIELPDLFAFQVRGETEVIGIDLQHTPHMADFAAGETAPLTPNLEAGGSTKPRLRRSADGSVWTCAALGPGSLLEIATTDAATPEDVRARVRELAASL